MSETTDRVPEVSGTSRCLRERSQFDRNANANVDFARPFRVTVACLRFDAMAD